MLDFIFVGLGGFLGAVLRYVLTLIPTKNPQPFPVITLLINVIGSLCIGLIALWMSKNSNLDSRLILFLKVGICGGFTTFSTFSADTVRLLRAGCYNAAAIYVALSVAVCIVFAALGMWIGTTFRN